MLWYKAWLENRTRFLISLFGIVALSSYTVFHDDAQALSYTKASYYNHVINGGHVTLALMWIFAVTFLTMGGLLREKSAGSSSFTLALPVSRARLMTVRIAMGLIQAMTLAIIPWAAMLAVTHINGRPPSAYQVCFRLALLAGGGVVFFAIALLVSSLVEGEYTAPLVSFGVAIVLMFGLRKESLRPYNPLDFMAGEPYLDLGTLLLTGPIPWLDIAVRVLIAALLMFLSVKAIERREF